MVCYSPLIGLVVKCKPYSVFKIDVLQQPPLHLSTHNHFFSDAAPAGDHPQATTFEYPSLICQGKSSISPLSFLKLLWPVNNIHINSPKISDWLKEEFDCSRESNYQRSQYRIVMADVNQSGFKSAPEFQEDSRASVIEPNTTDSTELWLIQWPKDQIPDFNGQQISLDLHRDDGQLGTFETKSGKSYDVVSFAAQEPKATVFLSTAEDSKILGKITRRVSFVHYLEPSEVPKDDTKRLKQLYEKSSGTSLTNSAYNFATPTRSTKPGRSSGRVSNSSGRKSSLSEENVRPKPSGTGQNSGHGSDHSEEKKAKKKMKHVA
ncbi:hypothetical protein QVD17_36542 [Tagetes erecta]|uniref:Mediator-associated protein 2 n=1 Tax=Tagetes erecta TaxID=13708 RepID=A0AAD8NBZ0_TARER|nr:hypothetical protein QVD17_36542 [Tagetes erecta]